MSNLYYDLLKEWCDSLLEKQINEIKSPGIYGGIICPACSAIHGRCADAVYPLMYMAHATGEERYLDGAVKLQAWSDHVSSPDGSWVNETHNMWDGITVFGTLSLAEAIRHHGMILDKPTYQKWVDRLKASSAFIYNTFTMKTGNINYPVTASAALAAAGKVLDDPKLLNKAREFAHNALDYFTENKILFGEGKPQEGFSPRGMRAVDLGYNVEESLPALVQYGLIMDDEEILQAATESLKSHLEFMLPDGAWDNSWGTRNFKWTYWGSRTSDGCQTAYALMSDRDPRFAAAAWRNTSLLKACTHNGLLHGGPHYHIKGELPCIHHTFCHAKALAAVLDYNKAQSTEEMAESGHISLPRETAQGVKEYPEIGTWLIAKGSWRSTVTSYDWYYVKDGHPSGGSISILWHKELGPVLASSMTEYALVESINMQRVKDSVNISLTPGIELLQSGKYYRSVNDYNAVVEYKSQEDAIWFRSVGKLVNSERNDPPAGNVNFSMEYLFKDNCVEISISGNFKALNGIVRYYLPVISNRQEEFCFNGKNNIDILKSGGKLSVSASLPIMLLNCDNSRVFNHVPGFEAIPLYLELNDTDKCTIRLAFENS